MMTQWLARRRDGLIGFALIAIVFLIHNIAHWNAPLYWDSLIYWTIGQKFGSSGEFSLLNYNNYLRGYLFPLILFIIQELAALLSVKGISLFRLLFPLLLSYFFTVSVPRLSSLLGYPLTYLQRITFALIAFWFWGGYLLYPLADFPALFLLVVAFCCILKHKQSEDGSRLSLFVAGLCLAASSLLRPTYLIVIPPLAIYALYPLRARLRANPHLLSRVLLLTIGLALPYLPQSYINQHHLGTMSPFIQTHRGGKDQNLYLQQLYWGIQYQRYDTQATRDYSTAATRFEDRQGKQILKREQLKKFESTSAFLGVATKYPADFATIYVRHFLNGLDVTHSTPYVQNIFSGRLLFSWTNYTVLFIALMILLRGVQQEALFLGLALLFPTLVSLPGAIEIRFFLPLHLICYLIVARNLSRDSLKPLMTAKVAAGYLLFILACFAWSATTFASYDKGPVLLQEREQRS